MTLPDIQHTAPRFPLPIDRVGIEGLTMPLPIASRQVATVISAGCALPPMQRGIHMSRFGESVLEVLRNIADIEDLMPLVAAIARNQQVSPEQVTLELSFTWFVNRSAPVSHVLAAKPVGVRLRYEKGREYMRVTSVETAVCPCSREMSLLRRTLSREELALMESLPERLQDKLLNAGYGAHGQKSEISVEIQLPQEDVYVMEGSFVAERIDRIVQLIESSASAPTFAILKRGDEQLLTEQAYSHPTFVEDIARNLAHVLGGSHLPYRVRVRNDESIHSGGIHAYAELSGE